MLQEFCGEKCLLMHTPRLQLYPSIILSFMDSEVYTESEKTSKCFQLSPLKMFHPTLLTKDAKMSFKRASSPLGLGGLCFILFLLSSVDCKNMRGTFPSGAETEFPGVMQKHIMMIYALRGRVVDNNIFEKWKEGKKKNQEMGENSNKFFYISR